MFSVASAVLLASGAVSLSLPSFPGPIGAFQPWLSPDQVKLHYRSVRQSIVDNYNDAVKHTPFALRSPLDLVQYCGRRDECPPNALYYASMHVNNDFYWSSITHRAPDIDASPEDGKLAKEIQEKWGSFEKMKVEWIQRATNFKGSGWLWLVLRGDTHEIDIIETRNEDNPTRDGHEPILVLDLWEHAYVLDYAGQPGKFAEKFWDYVNWHHAQGYHHKGRTYFDDFGRPTQVKGESDDRWPVDKNEL